MRINSHIVLIVVLFCVSITSQGQQHSFIHYTSEDGLSQSQINSIVQDTSGFIWIGTNGGLSRFDGKTFKNFSTLNGLAENQVYSLAVDENNQLWIRDQKGISKYNSNSFTHYPFNFSLSYLRDMYLDNDTIWFGCRQGLVKFFDGESELIQFSNEEDNDVRSVYRDKDGDLWIFTSTDAFRYLPKDSNSKNRLNIAYVSIIEESNNQTFLASIYDGIYKDFIEKSKFDTLNNGNSLFIRDIALENDGTTLWIATPNTLIRYDGKKYTVIDESNGLPYSDIKEIYVDRENVLWIGTDGNGLYKYSGDLITTYTKKDGLSSNLIMGITKKDSSLYTISYDKGVNVITNDTIFSINTPKDINTSDGWCITSDNKIYAGFSYGLAQIDDEEFIFSGRGDGLDDYRITALFYDEIKEAVLIGHRNGYTEFKDGEFTSNNETNGFPIKKVRHIKRDKNNDLWFVGSTRIAKYNDKNYTIYNAEDGFETNGFYNIAFYNDKVWVGTTSGLYYIQNNQIINYSFSSSPSDIAINSLLNDEKGRLWIGTNNGITSIYQNANEPDLVEHYGLENGIIGLETNMNASYVDEDGNLFFGTGEGLVRFDRKKLVDTKEVVFPKVVLTNLQLYLKDINWKNRGDSLKSGEALPVELRLKPNENYLTFHYSGINTRNPNKVKYRFMLLGAEGELSEKWSTPTSNSFATFSNLSSGDYIFRVQASTSTGKWKSHFTAYSFNIKTPFYATWWFRTIVISTILGILFLTYKARIRRIRQEQDNLFLRSQSKMLALEQQTLNANMNRHFVFNALNSIQYYLNKEDKKSANRYLSRFAKLIRKNLDSSQSKQTTLNEEIERMILYMELEQMRFAHKFEFSFHVDKGINTREISIPSMLFQPYLENSIWHGILPMESKGQIDVSIKLIDQGNLSIQIFDNGIGIDTSMKLKDEKPKDHISVGMEITKSRLALYSQIKESEASVTGPYELKKEGQTIGTQVELRLPLLRSE